MLAVELEMSSRWIDWQRVVIVCSQKHPYTGQGDTVIKIVINLLLLCLLVFNFSTKFYYFMPKLNNLGNGYRYVHKNAIDTKSVSTLVCDCLIALTVDSDTNSLYTHRTFKRVKLLNTLWGSCEILLSTKNLYDGRGHKCETSHQLMILLSTSFILLLKFLSMLWHTWTSQRMNSNHKQ